jgi:hypothetical protein
VRRLALLVGVALAAPVLAQGSSVQMAFLQAADAGDTSAMGRMLPGRVGLRGGASMPSREFLKMLSACYLRRVSAGDGGAMMANWMCREGEGSKMVLARVLDEGGSVVVEGVAETVLKTPPPPRTGSALGG